MFWERIIRLAAITPAVIILGGCASGGLGGLAGNGLENSETAKLLKANAEARTPQSELQKATVYWGQEFAKDPRNAEKAINYSKNLKAMGEKRRALAVLQQASVFNGGSREMASEYGRLALELDQVSLATKLLAQADDPAKPDWRIVSARGTAAAKQGSFAEAISMFERARVLAPGKSSILNNLALAYAMNGRPDQAENLLREAVEKDDPAVNGRVRQNLALVLGLQGKYDEATTVGGKDASSQTAKQNVQKIRSMVKLPPRLPPEEEAARIIALAKDNQTQKLKAAQRAKARPVRKASVKRRRKAKRRYVAVKPKDVKVVMKNKSLVHKASARTSVLPYLRSSQN